MTLPNRIQSPPSRPSHGGQQAALFRIGPPPARTPSAPSTIADLDRVRRQVALRSRPAHDPMRRPQSPMTRRAAASAWVAATTAPARQRECHRRPELFDLPDANQSGADTGDRKLAQGGLWPATFDDLDAERRAVATRVRQVKPAVNACKGCFFLDQCRGETLKDINCGRRPENVVVAGVAWTERGMPDPHVHNQVALREVNQLALDSVADIALYRDNPELNWIPADLEPTQTVDEATISAVLDSANIAAAREKEPSARFITQHRLDMNPELNSEGKVVLNHEEEFAVAQRACDLGLTIFNIATVLETSWARAADMVFVLGGDVQKHKPTAAAIARRAAREQSARRARELRDMQAQTVALRKRRAARLSGGQTQDRPALAHAG